jgi:xanthine dehydrogenase YagR molybdenum-binding subunit
MSSLVGAPVDRIDGRLKVTGAATYAAEHPLTNLAHGVLVQSTIANGRITRIDASAAEAAPGVLGVITHLNVPRLAAAPMFPMTSGQSYAPLQDDVVHHSGQHVAVVIAETLEQARFAATLVRVEYAAQPPLATLAEHHQHAVTPASMWGEPPDTVRGDPARALSEADVVIDEAYSTSVKHHNPIEPSATIATWDGDRLTLYDATQGVMATQASVAALLGVPPENVRVVSRFLGGGFGCKGFLWPHTVLTALAARQVGRPVKLVLTRAQSYTSHGHQPATMQHLRLGATRDGRLTGMVHASTSHSSPFDEYVEHVAVATPVLYACPNVATTHQVVRLNAGTPTPTRSPGEALGMIALESAMDELAYALGVDPVELRIRNHADARPADGRPWSSKRLLEGYRLGAERFGWAARTPEPRSMRDGNWLVGWGMGTAYHPDYRSPATASASVAADGRALVRCGTQDIGGGTYTFMAQIAADALGLPIEHVGIEIGDSRLPEGPMSAGSRTTASVGPAVSAACTARRSERIRLAAGDPTSPLFGAESRVAVENGRLFIADDPSRGETYAELLGRQGLDLVERSGTARPGPERQQYAIGSFGAVFAEVKVDPDLGLVRVSRLVGAYDIGRVINPKAARSQLTGGIIWGLGQALLEHTVTDRRVGRIVTANLSSYLVPVHADVPDVDVVFVDGFDPHASEIGAKGAGEIGPIGVPGAIANAIYHATGRRIRDFPITLDALL